MKATISQDTVRADFVQKVAEISGENFFNCYQCGNCSAGCPSVEEMDLLPSQVVRYLQLGLVEEVKTCKSMWVCAACLMCHARCPKGVDISKIMDALRVLRLREDEHNSRIDVTDFDDDYLERAPQIAMISGYRKFLSL
ncbi:MAG: 4Fe-4S dicluster domain-containing protein [Deltaproteobacteria bacterium]|nr:4Fe-4S dicluster domain-containing protein [Candidatus Anaeroferrophillus wilburensis]MBN2890037.1 4Fe-4S dicluster domain-containing protein [Deltaproteobacteria bacterium]